MLAAGETDCVLVQKHCYDKTALILQRHREGQWCFHLFMIELVLFLTLTFQLQVLGNIAGRLLTEAK